MDPKNSKIINIVGILIWVVLYWILIPNKIIEKYPLVLIGFFYTIFILLINTFFIGSYYKKNGSNLNTGSDFKEHNFLDVVKLINEKAVHVSTATFAMALVSREIFKINFYKELVIFMIYTLIFGVGVIIPIYFLSNQKNNSVIFRYNEIIARIRNVSLSYSVGFMISSFMIAINRIYTLYI